MDLLKKLNYRNGNDIWVLGSPPQFEIVLQQLKESVEVHHDVPTDSAIPFLLVFVKSQKEVMLQMESVRDHLDIDTICWFAYPKKSSKNYTSDVTRDIGWSPLGDAGYEPVRQIAIDDDWSALRFKPVSQIKRLTRRTSMALSDAAKELLQKN